MKAAVFLVCILALAAPTEYRDPYVTIPEEVEARAGEPVQIEVIVEHVQTTMWNLQVYVDTSQVESRFLQWLKVTQTEENSIHFEEEIPPGTKVSAVIDIDIAENSSSGQVKIPIIAKGSKGPCLKGCEPFFIQRSTILLISRQDLRLALMLPEARFESYPGENIRVEVQLKNYGAATAYVESLEALPDKQLNVLKQTVPGQVAPGTTESVFFTVVTGGASPGTYLVQVKLIFKDQIQSTFTDSKTVYITILQEDEPPPSTPPATVTPDPGPVQPENPDEKYLYFLAGVITGAALFAVAVMAGIFAKKRRPTK